MSWHLRVGEAVINVARTRPARSAAGVASTALRRTETQAAMAVLTARCTIE
jgi:hypothetical protein